MMMCDESTLWNRMWWFHCWLGGWGNGLAFTDKRCHSRAPVVFLIYTQRLQRIYSLIYTVDLCCAILKNNRKRFTYCFGNNTLKWTMPTKLSLWHFTEGAFYITATLENMWTKRDWMPYKIIGSKVHFADIEILCVTRDNLCSFNPLIWGSSPDRRRISISRSVPCWLLCCSIINKIVGAIVYLKNLYQYTNKVSNSMPDISKATWNA